MKKKIKKPNKLQKALLIALAVLFLLTAASLIYLSDSYPCDEAAVSEFAETVSVEMREVEKGILCVLVKMPFNMAFFDANAADRVFEKFPNVEKWYIGGHSLGGSIACSYAANNSEKLNGVILLGSYSIDSLAESGLKVLTVMGSEDSVVGEDYDKFRHMLPESTEETELIGGCHAGFGMYGPQKGDGTPTLTNTDQIRMTSDIVAGFVAK